MIKSLSPVSIGLLLAPWSAPWSAPLSSSCGLPPAAVHSRQASATATAKHPSWLRVILPHYPPGQLRSKALNAHGTRGTPVSWSSHLRYTDGSAHRSRSARSEDHSAAGLPQSAELDTSRRRSARKRKQIQVMSGPARDARSGCCPLSRIGSAAAECDCGRGERERERLGERLGERLNARSAGLCAPAPTLERLGRECRGARGRSRARSRATAARPPPPSRRPPLERRSPGPLLPLPPQPLSPARAARDAFPRRVRASEGERAPAAMGEFSRACRRSPAHSIKRSSFSPSRVSAVSEQAKSRHTDRYIITIPFENIKLMLFIY